MEFEELSIVRGSFFRPRARVLSWVLYLILTLSDSLALLYLAHSVRQFGAWKGLPTSIPLVLLCSTKEPVQLSCHCQSPETTRV